MAGVPSGDRDSWGILRLWRPPGQSAVSGRGCAGVDAIERRLREIAETEAVIRRRTEGRCDPEKDSEAIAGRYITRAAVGLEGCAFVYALIRATKPGIGWKDVAPVLLIPAAAAIALKAFVLSTKMNERRDQELLESLSAERKAKIQELRQSYSAARRLLDKYDIEPVEKAVISSDGSSSAEPRTGSSSRRRIQHENLISSRSNRASTSAPLHHSTSENTLSWLQKRASTSSRNITSSVDITADNKNPGASEGGDTGSEHKNGILSNASVVDETVKPGAMSHSTCSNSALWLLNRASSSAVDLADLEMSGSDGNKVSGAPEFASEGAKLQKGVPSGVPNTASEQVSIFTIESPRMPRSPRTLSRLVDTAWRTHLDDVEEHEEHVSELTARLQRDNTSAPAKPLGMRHSTSSNTMSWLANRATRTLLTDEGNDAEGQADTATGAKGLKRRGGFYSVANLSDMPTEVTQSDAPRPEILVGMRNSTSSNTISWLANRATRTGSTGTQESALREHVDEGHSEVADKLGIFSIEHDEGPDANADAFGESKELIHNLNPVKTGGMRHSTSTNTMSWLVDRSSHTQGTEKHDPSTMDERIADRGLPGNSSNTTNSNLLVPVKSGSMRRSTSSDTVSWLFGKAVSMAPTSGEHSSPNINSPKDSSFQPINSEGMRRSTSSGTVSWLMDRASGSHIKESIPEDDQPDIAEDDKPGTFEEVVSTDNAGSVPARGALFIDDDLAEEETISGAGDVQSGDMVDNTSGDTGPWIHRRSLSRGRHSAASPSPRMFSIEGQSSLSPNMIDVPDSRGNLAFPEGDDGSTATSPTSARRTNSKKTASWLLSRSLSLKRDSDAAGENSPRLGSTP